MLIGIAFAVACDRDMLDPDPDAIPGFSTDTVSFDTVFTSIGSATLSFKVYNHSRRPILISSIELAGGESSFFRLNIDGEPVTRVDQVEIPSDDSLFVFIAVTVDPTHVNNPVVIKDSIVFITNGHVQDVKLIAFGQDVHLIDGEVIETTTWMNDKPYLIYNSMAVDTGHTLTIEAGTHIYFHRNSSMIVWGTLVAEGTWDDPVLFQNDRLEEFYRVIPGQWGTIYFDPISRGNKLNYTIIKNAITGIQIGYPSDYHVPELELSNSQIMNVSYTGIYAFGAELLCYNSVIANSAGPLVALLRGGNYRFLHCTLSNNGVLGDSRSSPSVLLTNTFTNSELDDATGEYVYVIRTGDLEQAQFVNSIIDGSYSHEIQLTDNQDNQFEYLFDYCLLKAHTDSVKNTNHFRNLILNVDPCFINDNDRYHLNYALDTLSPAKDSAGYQWIQTYPFLNTDITGNSRLLDNKPDLGAFERREE